MEDLIMNKIDLVRAIANNAGLTLKDAGNALDGFIAAVTEELKKGEKIKIAAAKVPAFKFGKAYKDQF